MIFAIVEDDLSFQKELAGQIEAWAEERKLPCPGMVVFSTAEQFLFQWEEGYLFDLLFLDIQLPGLSGFQLAEKVRQTDSTIPMIFVTELDTYLQKGYEVGIYRYLEKPIDRDALYRLVDAIWEKNRLLISESIVLLQGKTSIRVAFRDIMYAEAGIHTITVRKSDGSENRMTGNSFEAFCNMLPLRYFIRCHRSYIFNIQYIKSFSADRVVLSDGSEFIVSRKYREETMLRLNHYFLKEAGV